MEESNKIKKLERVIKEWEQKGEDFFKESNIARKHNYTLEAINLNDKYTLIREFCRDIEMRVIKELIN